MFRGQHNQMISLIELKAYAKVNLFLEVLGKRGDGYHELVTVMQEIDLHDDLVIEEADSGISLTCSDSSIPTGRDNLIWKAAELLLSRYKVSRGARIRLEKRIPVGAGLGGGSSDAAAALKGLNVLWGTGCSDQELMEMAGEIGSDVPFFISGKSAVCSGRGEVVSPLLFDKECAYVVVYPNIKINTVEIYKNLRLGLTKEMKDVNSFLRVFERCCPVNIGRCVFNRLEETVCRLYPDLLKLRNILCEFDFCGVQVSGSGSSLFGLCERRCDAEKFKEELTKRCSASVFVAHSVR